MIETYTKQKKFPKHGKERTFDYTKVKSRNVNAQIKDESH